MPIPKPRNGESEDAFIARCMGDDGMQEYPQDQRAAICYGQFRQRSAAAGVHPMKIREKLHELQRARAAKRAELEAFMTKQDDDAPPAADDGYEQIMAELQELESRIDRCERAISASAPDDDEPKAEDDNGGNDDDNGGNNDDDDEEKRFRRRGVSSTTGLIARGGARVWATPKRSPYGGTQKGFRVARFMIGLVHQKWYGHDKAVEFIDNRFHDSLVTRALNYSVVAEGGALIPQDFMAELIELLRANVVVREAGPMTVQMPMGNLTIPRLAAGSTAMYQGELDDISVTEELFDDLNLVAKKLTAMVPVSNDLIRRAPIGVESIIRDDLIQGIARKEDVQFLRSDGTNKGPVGWRSLVLPANLLVVPPLGATPPAGADLNAVVAALASMKLLLVNGMSRMIKPAWFMAPTVLEYIRTRRDSVGGFYYRDEIAAGTLDGFPYFISQQIPTNLGSGNGSEIYLVDMADTIIGDTLNVMVDASDVAAYYGTDGKVVSTFQRDQSLFRVITEHDFNMRHLQSLAVATTSDWMFAGLPGVPGAAWSTQPLNPHWAQAPAAWPASTTHDAAPTIYDPAVVHSSAFQGTLTANAGGGPYPLTPGGPIPTDAPPGDAPPPPPPSDPPSGRGGGGSGRTSAQR
jgi:HK97 family phage major capsid protein